MRVFFSFAYTEDHHRAKTIMEQYLVHPNTSATGFIEDGEIDRMCEEGLVRVYQWIEGEVSKADVVVVLIGHNTAGKHFVEYEIAQAQKNAKPIIGIFIEGLPDQNGQLNPKGRSSLFPVFPLYDYIKDQGANDLPLWLQKAKENHPSPYNMLREVMTQMALQTRARRQEQ